MQSFRSQAALQASCQESRPGDKAIPHAHAHNASIIHIIGLRFMAYNDQSPPIPLLAADVDSGQEEEKSETY